MTDKEYNKQKKRIQKLTEKLVRPLGFGWFGIDVEYERHRDQEEAKTIAKCYTMPEYMMSTIVFFMPEVALLPDDKLEATYIHELSHILTAPLAANPNSSTVEQSTELVARTIRYAMDHNFEEKK